MKLYFSSFLNFALYKSRQQQLTNNLRSFEETQENSWNNVEIAGVGQVAKSKYSLQFHKDYVLKIVSQMR